MQKGVQYSCPLSFILCILAVGLNCSCRLKHSCFCCAWSLHLEWPLSPTTHISSCLVFPHIPSLSLKAFIFPQGTIMLKAPLNSLYCERRPTNIYTRKIQYDS